MKLNEILNLFRQGKSTAKSHMKNLIEMAAADGNFREVEFQLLVSIAKKYGISEKELSHIKSNPQQIELEIPVNPIEKFNQLYDLTHMMIVDKDIHIEELKLCNLFAIRFGYRAEIAEELVQSIKNNISQQHGPEETRLRVEWMIK
ncbi:MAG TPA: hypothetical protein PKC24_04635 [Cyclobacteriaceae bacterium]|nr:hypothetical protein [Cyclobacteriaceae bacterium]